MGRQVHWEEGLLSGDTSRRIVQAPMPKMGALGHTCRYLGGLFPSGDG